MQLRRIIELPKHIYEKIAAGEVVDRPASIVKELVENSIDSGADMITVEVKEGGKSFIRVTDNGCGIPKDQAETAFKRHATSKLETAEDLDRIMTLGFRGEALASISAVARVELITKTEDQESGLRLVIEGGEIAERSDIGCADGTSIMVSRLFFNTPARLKFLKSDNVESRRIIELISKLTLAYPNIRFRMINNGNNLFTTPGRGDVISCINTVYGHETGKGLISYKTSVQADDEGSHMSLEAYISPPSVTKTARKSQIFFINGRSVTSKVLEKAVSDAYKERLFEGRYPIAFLFLTVDPSMIDVNIHPNKQEVRFTDESAVREFVTKELRRALLSEESVPVFSRPEKKDKTTVSDSSDIDTGMYEAKIKEEQLTFSDKTVLEETVREDAYEHDDTSCTISDAPAFPPGMSQEEIRFRTYLRQKRAEEEADKAEKIRRSSEAHQGENGSSRWVRQPAPPAKFDIGGIEPVGTVFSTYILARNPESLFIIDQHAAHERVFYERYMDQYYNEEKLTQQLLTPIMIDIPHVLKNASSEWMDFLQETGFDIEPFGTSTAAIRGIPAHMDMSEAEEFVKELIDNIDEKTDFKDQKRIDKIITRSCKSAVKANYNMTTEEIRILLKDLSSCINPFSCPHGRPTIIRITAHELEHMFKRA